MFISALRPAFISALAPPFKLAVLNGLQALFNQNVGAWFRPAQAITMPWYQDSAGTTPVTAVEQPVGLALDRSAGVSLGPELVVNGDFTNGAVGYTATANASNAVSAGQMTLTALAGIAGFSEGTSFNLAGLIVGKTYQFSIDNVSGVNSGRVRVQSSLTSSFYVNNGVLKAKGYFVAPSTGMQVFVFIDNNVAGSSNVIDNISVKLLDGNHVTQPTTASRPVLSSRVNLLVRSEQFDGGVAWTGGGLTPPTITPNVSAGADGTMTADLITVFEANHNFQQNFTVVPGVSYVFSFYSKRGTLTDQKYSVYNLSGATEIVVPTSYYSQVNASTLSRVSVGFVAPVGCTSVNVYVLRDSGVAGNATFWGAEVELGTVATRYQRVNTATDYDTVGFQSYEKFDGVDDSLSSVTGGGGTAGFFFCQAIKPTGGAGTVRTLWSDAQANAGYRVRVNAANQVELSSGSGTPLAPPVQSAAVNSATGGTGLAASTAYFYVVTALNGKGESLRSNEVTVTTTAGTTDSNAIAWAASSGAASYRVNRGTATGTQNVFYAVGNVLAFTDTGAAGTAGSPPTISETAYTAAATAVATVLGATTLVTAWDETRALVNQFVASEGSMTLGWTAVAGTLSNNAALSPIGSLSAASLVPNTVSNTHGIVQNAGTIGNVYTQSIYAKANGYTNLQIYADSSGNFNATFNLSNGTAASTGGATVSIADVGGGWYRCSATFTQAASTRLNFQGFPTGSTANNFGNVFAGDGTSGILVWGAQIDLGSVATTYQRVNTAGDFNNRLLNVQIDSGTVAQIGTLAPAAGTAAFTIGKQNGVAAGFFTGSIYESVYARNTGLTPAQRLQVQRQVAAAAGLAQ